MGFKQPHPSACLRLMPSGKVLLEAGQRISDAQAQHVHVLYNLELESSSKPYEYHPLARMMASITCLPVESDGVIRLAVLL